MGTDETSLLGTACARDAMMRPASVYSCQVCVTEAVRPSEGRFEVKTVVRYGSRCLTYRGHHRSAQRFSKARGWSSERAESSRHEQPATRGSIVDREHTAGKTACC